MLDGIKWLDAGAGGGQQQPMLLLLAALSAASPASQAYLECSGTDGGIACLKLAAEVNAELAQVGSCRPKSALSDEGTVDSFLALIKRDPSLGKLPVKQAMWAGLADAVGLTCSNPPR